MGGRYLVTGGAGYVGSHIVKALVERGDDVVVLDDLRQGHRAAVPPSAELVVADISDRRRRLGEVFAAWRFDAVFHFAALSLVGESMRDLLRYCSENLSNSLAVADAAVTAGASASSSPRPQRSSVSRRASRSMRRRRSRPSPLMVRAN